MNDSYVLTESGGNNRAGSGSHQADQERRRLVGAGPWRASRAAFMHGEGSVDQAAVTLPQSVRKIRYPDLPS